MDLAEAFNAPVVEKVGGEDVSFPIIPVTIIGTVISVSAKKFKRQRALDTIKDFGLTGQEKLVIAQNAGNFYFDDIHDYVSTPDGSNEAVRISLERVGGKTREEATEIISKMAPYQVNSVALLVTQFAHKVTDKPVEAAVAATVEAEKKESDPNLGYGDPDPTTK